MKLLVIGHGAWSTTLAVLLAERGNDVSLWTLFAEQAETIARTRENARFLPGIAIPESIDVLSPTSGDIDPVDLAVVAVPTQYLRTWLTTLKPQLPPLPAVVSGGKGIENDTLARPTEIIREVLETGGIAVLSGPSHAEEVSRGLPTTVVAASDDAGLSKRIQKSFSTERFRVYTSTDVTGVELAGALKNVIALSAGICDGLGFGDNSKSALMTRGLVEMARLGEAMGARRDTFAGLAGMGDLITTCTSPFGRNLAVGRALGAGETLEAIVERMKPVIAEGVASTRSVRALAVRHHVEMPITEQVHHILFEGKSPKQGVIDLMQRDLRPERD